MKTTPCIVAFFLAVSLCASRADDVRQPTRGSVSLVVWPSRRPGVGLDESALESIERIRPDFVALHAFWDLAEREEGYDFSATDRALDMLRERGVPVRLVFYMASLRVLPRELRAEISLDQKGKVAARGRESLSLWGDRSRPRFLKFVDAAVRRYRGDPGVIQWSFINGYSENYWSPGTGYFQLFDYSAFSQRKFRWFLQHVKQFSLEEVNERAAKTWKSWDDVAQPHSVWDKVSLSPFWADFQEYRCWSALQQAQDVCEIMQKHDPTRLIFVFGNSHPFNQGHFPAVTPRFATLARKHRGGMYITSGGTVLLSAVTGDIRRRLRIELSSESAYTPEREAHFSFYLFNALEADVDYYQLIVHHPATWEPALVHFQKLRPALHTLANARPAPRRVGFLVSYATGLSYVSWLPSTYHNENCQPIWGRVLNNMQASRELHYELEAIPDEGGWNLFKGLKGILDSGSVVLREEMIERLRLFVARGGRLALFGDSGRYVYGSGRWQGHALAEALGYTTRDPWPSPPIEGMAGWLDVIYRYEGSGPKKAPRAAASFRAKATTPLHVMPRSFDVAYPYELPMPTFPSQVLAVGPKGGPVCLRWKHGRGEVLMLSGFPDFRAHSGYVLLDAILRWLGAERRTQCSAKISALHKLAGGKHHYVLANLTDERISDRVRFLGLARGCRYAARNLGWKIEDYGLLEASDYSIQAEWDPFEIKVIRLDPLGEVRGNK